MNITTDNKKQRAIIVIMTVNACTHTHSPTGYTKIIATAHPIAKE